MKVFAYLIMSFFILATIMFVCVAYISEAQTENKKFDVIDTNKTSEEYSGTYYTYKYYCTMYLVNPMKNPDYAGHCALAKKERNNAKENR